MEEVEVLSLERFDVCDSSETTFDAVDPHHRRVGGLDVRNKVRERLFDVGEGHLHSCVSEGASANQETEIRLEKGGAYLARGRKE